MSLTILSRPIGHRLNITDVDALIIDDGTGDALVYTTIAHGLSDGDYVYIESNLDSYNGYFYVDSIAYDSFKIKTSEEGDFVEFVQDASISYRPSVLNHGWQCVHLPIVYEIESDVWPNNTAEESYNPNTVVTQANSNGYTQLNLIHAITPTPSVLNFIELVGTGELAGPYQILEVVHPWSIVINLAYSAANSFTGYLVVNYYNNYAINVNVYAGLDPAHRWVTKKPYELAATLKFIPDSEGKVKFSIADILKGYITTRNNLTLDTLPNNLDFHTSFYISFFESYDQSDGEVLTTFEGEVTTDTFEGHAVNAKLPFKSLNSGHLSPYVNEDTFLARWLTLFDRPLMVVDRFFDLSFLLQYNGFDVLVTVYKSYQGVVTSTEVITITNPGLGVIRVPFMPESGYDEYCIQAAIYASLSIAVLSLSSNYGSGDESWTISPNPAFTGLTTLQISTILRIPIYDAMLNQQIDFVINLDFNNLGGSGGNFNTKPLFYLFDANMANSVQIGGGDIGGVYVSAGNKVESHTLIATGFVPAFLAMNFEYTGGGGFIMGVDINSATITPVITNQNITEQICCDVIDECSPTFVNDNLRLLEGGQFRELE